MMRILLAGVCVLGLAGCSMWQGEAGGATGKLELTPTTFDAIRGWNNDNQAEALTAFLKSCAVFATKPETAAIGQGKLLAPVKVWKEVCRKAEAVPVTDAAPARAFFENHFVPFKAFDGENSVGLYTGYYEPLLKGSLTRQRPFVYPVYGLPPEGTPTYTRAQIDFNALAGHTSVLAYVDDPVQLFFLHVQGSGRIRLEGGDVLRVGYAGSNGLPYTSIGKAMVKKGVLTKEQVSMQSIKQWLYDHPSDMWQAMWENTSYVFFRPLNGDPVGTGQAPLTAGRSLAVDARFISFGMPVFVDTILPATDGMPLSIHRKLLIAQDTGSAIRGPLRGDIFFGFGTEAEQRAGVMRSGGERYLLVPRALANLLGGDA
jgi:membrane-bound lytic murein transglycosylase A